MTTPVLSYASHDAILAFWLSKSPSVALLTVAPNPDGTGVTEPNFSDGYARKSVSLSPFTRSAGVSSTTNENAMVFGPANTNDWATVTYACLIGNDDTLLAYAPLPSTRTCAVGDSISFGISALQWRMK